MESSEFEHKFNPLHLYCRLVDLGLDKDYIHEKVKDYEIYFYKPIMRKLQLKLHNKTKLEDSIKEP